MVVVNRLTKYVHFELYLESLSIDVLAYSFNKCIIANHGIPRNIISDRDKWLISNFWKLLMKSLGSKQLMTLVYYLQANG
jgi:hypothetical protein